jgi:hypothetical protein
VELIRDSYEFSQTKPSPFFVSRREGEDGRQMHDCASSEKYESSSINPPMSRFSPLFSCPLSFDSLNFPAAGE